MEYRNTKTGAVINVDSEIGGHWEPVKASSPAKEEPAPTKKRRTTKNERIRNTGGRDCSYGQELHR